jgi:hypothetical protein
MAAWGRSLGCSLWTADVPTSGCRSSLQKAKTWPRSRSWRRSFWSGLWLGARSILSAMPRRCRMAMTRWRGYRSPVQRTRGHWRNKNHVQ